MSNYEANFTKAAVDFLTAPETTAAMPPPRPRAPAKKAAAKKAPARQTAAKKVWRNGPEEAAWHENGREQKAEYSVKASRARGLPRRKLDWPRDRARAGARPRDLLAHRPPGARGATHGCGNRSRRGFVDREAARASSGSKKAKARSGGRGGYHVGRLPPTPSVSSFMRWPTISATSCEHWRRRSRSRTGC